MLRGKISENADFVPIASLVLVASQSPVKLVFLEMRRTHVVVDVEAGARGFCDNLGRVFDIFPLKNIKDSDLHVGLGEELFVLPHCHFEGRQVYSNSQPIPFEDFVQGVPDRRPRASARDGTQRRDRVDAADLGLREQFLRDHPWLSEADVDLALGRTRPTPHGRTRGAARRDGEDEDVVLLDEDEGVVLPVDDDEMEAPDAVFDPAELAALRDEQDVPEHALLDFYVRVLGGAWTLRHTGAVADGCSYYCRAGDARLWCETFNFPKQKGFMYARYGGPNCPPSLCNELALRAQFYFNMWSASDDDNFIYSVQQLDSYVDSYELIELMCDHDVLSASFEKGMEIRNLKPTNFR